MLVTLAFALTRTRLFTRLLQPRLSARDQAGALLLFLVMALTEEMVAQQHTPMNARIIAACAAGFLAGPWVGGLVGVGATVFAFAFQHVPPAGFGLAITLAGVGAGLLRRRWPGVAQQPGTGFLLGFVASLLRYGTATLLRELVPTSRPPLSLLMESATALVNGLGVALILVVVAQVREHEAQARAAALAEVRALQARMNPHFLFNALNTVAALSAINPRAVPAAVTRLGRFLRASLDQHDRVFIPLTEELAVVSAYLDIEALRLGERLRVEQDIAADVRDLCVPPFLIQPLVENAVLHGIQPSPDGGVVRLRVQSEGSHLVVTVADTGVGMALALPPGDGSGAHALALLRRRLGGLYGSDFALNLRRGKDAGTTVTVRVPRGPGRGDLEP